MTAILALTGFGLLFQRYVKPYDLLIASLFMLALVALHKRRWIMYLILFALATLAKETAVLLLPVFMVHLWNKVSPNTYWSLAFTQLYLFIILQVFIRVMYQDAPGVTAWVMPLENTRAHLSNIPMTLFALIVLGIGLYFTFRHWYTKPPILRTAFVILFPIFMLLYIVCGQAFEYRTFAEVYPIMAALVVQHAP